MSFLVWYASERLRGGIAAAVLTHLAFNASVALLRTDPLVTTAACTATVVLLAVLVHRVTDAGRVPLVSPPRCPGHSPPAGRRGDVVGWGVMGRRAFRVRSVLAAIGPVALLVAGCGIVHQTYTVTDNATVPDRITGIRLDNSAGAATVDGRPGTTAVALNRSIDSPNQTAPGPTYRVENGTLVLGGCGQQCSVKYTLTVPPGLPVTGSTSAGEVVLSSVGSVDVRTTAGEITLDDIAGPTRVESTNGGIRGTRIRGADLQARTSNGAIDLTPTTAQNVRASTTNGTIELTVPPGPYRIDARTNNGDRRIDVLNDPAGRYTLDLSTSNVAIGVHSG